jgi:hypothetical protein
MLSPQATQAHRRPQLPRLGLLAAGHLDGLVKAGFGFSVIALHEQQLCPQPVELCFPVALVRLFHQGEGLSQGGQAFLWVACLCLRLGQRAKLSWQVQPYARRLHSRHALPHLRHPLLDLSQHGQSLSSEVGCHPRPAYKALFIR